MTLLPDRLHRLLGLDRQVDQRDQHSHGANEFAEISEGLNVHASPDLMGLLRTRTISSYAV